MGYHKISDRKMTVKTYGWHTQTKIKKAKSTKSRNSYSQLRSLLLYRSQPIHIANCHYFIINVLRIFPRFFSILLYTVIWLPCDSTQMCISYQCNQRNQSYRCKKDYPDFYTMSVISNVTTLSRYYCTEPYCIRLCSWGIFSGLFDFCQPSVFVEPFCYL